MEIARVPPHAIAAAKTPVREQIVFIMPPLYTIRRPAIKDEEGSQSALPGKNVPTDLPARRGARTDFRPFAM